MVNILIVEDNLELQELLKTVLSKAGYQPFIASNGVEALAMMAHQHIDLVISDVMMPQMDGYELTTHLRHSNLMLPILMVTVKDQLKDKQAGFLAGVDDYMIKPIDVNELLWRVKALLRRAKIASERLIVLGQTTLNYDAFTLTRLDEVQELPQKEFLLLYKLSAVVGKILTRQQLFDEIWGFESEASMHTLEVHISRLRERIKQNPDFEIATVRGLGYKLVTSYEE